MTKPKTGLRTLKPSIRTIGPTVRVLDSPSSSYSGLYSHRAWRRRRDAHLLAEPCCRLCHAIDGRIVPATVADHIVPHQGDRVAFFTGELASLCKSCHDSRKAMMEHQGDHTLPPPVFAPRTKPLIV